MKRWRHRRTNAQAIPPGEMTTWKWPFWPYRTQHTQIGTTCCYSAKSVAGRMTPNYKSHIAKWMCWDYLCVIAACKKRRIMLTLVTAVKLWVECFMPECYSNALRMQSQIKECNFRNIWSILWSATECPISDICINAIGCDGQHTACPFVSTAAKKNAMKTIITSMVVGFFFA